MILCCGEALVDLIPDADGTLVPHPGGAVFNTALALGRLGVEVGLLTGLSTDAHGRMLAATLAESGVETRLSIRTDRPTTRAIVTLENGVARYRFKDEGSAGRMLRPADMPVPGPEVGTLVFGGNSLAVEPGAEAFAALLDRAAGSRVMMIDPNIRPDFIADEARYRARLGAMLARADIVKVSDEDLDWLAPGAAALAGKVQAIGATGIVIVTEGARGATAVLPGGRTVQVAAKPVTVVDTVGAGDAFNAGVLAHLARAGLLDRKSLAVMSDDQVAAAIAHGHRVAAVTVSRAGANPPRAHEL
ncbi:carbohydrate kinase [Pseudooceanicola sp. LIPI14-2-Ac024]|uniref:carbohydrate kinase family protein n=1 Tax=Pseudooceanicola sp. LIPI14-2-Ac024 TaxID=3344875 RepID=UPI0035D07DE2